MSIFKSSQKTDPEHAHDIFLIKTITLIIQKPRTIKKLVAQNISR